MSAPANRLYQALNDPGWICQLTKRGKNYQKMTQIDLKKTLEQNPIFESDQVLRLSRPQDFFIRPMTVADLVRILELEQQCFSSPWSRQIFESELKNDGPPGLHIVGVYQDEIICYSNTWFVIDEAHISNVAVAPKYQGQKVGETMLRYIIRTAMARRMVCVHLEVRITNVAAIRLYDKLGFEVIGVRKRYYEDNHEDALLMQLDLNHDQV